MKEIILENFVEVENFKIKNLPIPTVNVNEIHVKIKTFSVNPVDVKTRKGS